MIRSAALEVDLRTVSDAANVAPRTAVGIPPSDVEVVSDEMRVAASGTIIYRAFDPATPA